MEGKIGQFRPKKGEWEPQNRPFMEDCRDARLIALGTETYDRLNFL